MTAEDVVYSLDRILSMKLGAFSLFADVLDVGSAAAPDDRTVVFTLKKPSAIFLATVPEIYVVNKDLVQSHEVDGDWGGVWMSQNEAGSGSYMLTRYDPAIGFQAKRFEDHFRCAHVFDHEDVRILAQRRTERAEQFVGVAAYFALTHERGPAVVHDLDTALERDHVIAARSIDQIHEGRHQRGLAARARSDDEYEAFGFSAEGLDLAREPELVG